MSDQPERLEPLYTLAVAAEMVPFGNLGSLRDYLCRHRRLFPSRFMPMNGRPVRMLTLTEVKRLRAMRTRDGQRLAEHAKRAGQRLQEAVKRKKTTTGSGRLTHQGDA